MTLESLRRTLKAEAEAILHLSENLDRSFSEVVDRILLLQGRLVFCGLGKSGHIGRKAAGTFASTGTPCLYLHAAEALHGDLGMVTAEDLVAFISHSGETDEIIQLLPAVRQIGAGMVAITGRPNSTMARGCDIVLNTHVSNEACSNNLAPTTSTTTMLALTDALAIAVMDAKGFGKADFARLHPSGTLGKRLTLTVADTMISLKDCAVVTEGTPCLEVLKSITQAGVGAALVTNDDQLLGLISDGDLRRHLLQSGGDISQSGKDLMTPSPQTIEPSIMAMEALEIFQNAERKIGELPVVDGDKVVGLLTLKDLLRSGIV